MLVSEGIHGNAKMSIIVLTRKNDFTIFCNSVILNLGNSAPQRPFGCEN